MNDNEDEKGHSNGLVICGRCRKKIPFGNYAYHLPDGVERYGAGCYRDFILPAYQKAKRVESKRR
jgi:hypothetical protein